MGTYSNKRTGLVSRILQRLPHSGHSGFEFARALISTTRASEPLIIWRVTEQNTNDLKRSRRFSTVLMSIVFSLGGLMVSRKNNRNRQWKAMLLFYSQR